MTAYQSTRRDLKKFLRDLKPGHTYWSVETADSPLNGMEYARPWVFKKSRLWGGTCGHMSAEAVLSNYGPLYDSKPAGVPDLFDDRDHAFEPDLEGKAYKNYQQALKDLRRKARQMAGA